LLIYFQRLLKNLTDCCVRIHNIFIFNEMSYKTTAM